MHQGPNKYIERDISWLSFNERILFETDNDNVPLYDKVKFLAIYSSNLDEFFRVRVASIRNIVKISKKKINAQLDFEPGSTLKKILEISYQQQLIYGEILSKKIIPQLKEQKIILYWNKPLLKSHMNEVRHYFLSNVMSYLQPIFISTGRQAFLENRCLYFMVKLRKEDDISFAYLNIPSDVLPRFLALKLLRDRYYYIFIDDVIRANLSIIFPGYEICGCYSIKMNRDADLAIEDEYSGDLIEKIKKQLNKREIGSPTRVLYDERMPEEILDVLKSNFNVEIDELIPGGRYHNLHDLMQLPNPLKPRLQEKGLSPLKIAKLEYSDSIFSVIDREDVMLHFPYHSYNYVLRFFNEAAIHPEITEIKATIYRVAKDSFIVNALISAAKNGKKVTVFVEVKARFDEENNLEWARKMEEAGVRIIYSMPGLKVHAKVALVTRKNEMGKKHYAFFGTGNFNENTARVYADDGLLTAHKDMTKELGGLFKYLIKGRKIKSIDHLLIAGVNLKSKFLELIDREIRNVQQGKKGYMILKLNNLEEKQMIDKLYEASQAGVIIELIVRGICCLRPGLKEVSENISVTRIVDQYLEHSRIFYFYNDDDDEIYLSSADWMKRNLHRRIEVGFPVYNEKYCRELKMMLEMQLADNVKGVRLGPNLENNFNNVVRMNKNIRSQIDFYKYLLGRFEQANSGKTK